DGRGGVRGGGGLVQPLFVARDRRHHRPGHGRGPDRVARPGARPPGRRAAAGGRDSRLARGARRRLPVGTVRPAPAAIADHRLPRAPDYQPPDRPAAGHLSGALGGPARLGRLRLVPGGTMTWHAVTIAGYVLVVAGIVVLQLLASKTSVPVPSFGELLTRAMRSRTRRGGGLVAWGGVGLPFFAQ